MVSNIINNKEYRNWLDKIKSMIHTARTKAALSLSGEMIHLYWDIGYELDEKVDRAGWGAKVIDQLAMDINIEFPDLKGFGRSNLFSMKKFFTFYSNAVIETEAITYLTANLIDLQNKGLIQLEAIHNNRDTNKILVGAGKAEIIQQAVGLLSGDSSMNVNKGIKVKLVQQAVGLIPWGHNVTIINKIKDVNEAIWYVTKSIEQAWTRDILLNQIDFDLYKRQAKANIISNFKATLPAKIVKQAENIIKDPYVFDFANLTEEALERDIEKQLVKHLSRFLIELGKGFAFVGQQYPIAVSNKDYRIDLLFYHLKLHSYIVIELKTGEFKPEYTGQINFYLSAVDEMVKDEKDNPSIGIIICKSKDDVIAKYALKGMKKAIGVSEYKLTKAIPKNLKPSLPTVKEIEEKLSEDE